MGARTPTCNGHLTLEKSRDAPVSARPASVRDHSHYGGSHPKRAKGQSPHKDWQRATRQCWMPSPTSQPARSPDLTRTRTQGFGHASPAPPQQAHTLTSRPLLALYPTAPSPYFSTRRLNHCLSKACLINTAPPYPLSSARPRSAAAITTSRTVLG